MENKTYKQNGFSLVEVSIVLIVIGLITAGILVGADIIQGAKIRKQISQIQEISSAYNLFQTKYHGLPGDIFANAESYGLSFQGSSVTKDDGMLEDQSAYDDRDANGVMSTMSRTVDHELVLFFGHLVEAKLLPRNFVRGTSLVHNAGRPNDNCIEWAGPTEPFNGEHEGKYYAMTLNPQMGMSAFTYDDKTWIYLGLSDCAAWLFRKVDKYATMTPKQGFAIDSKLDDGVPSTGDVLAFRSSDIDIKGDGSFAERLGIIDNKPSGSNIGDVDNNCVTDTAGTAYSLADESNQCRLLVRLQ